jgi:hypothetical protein
MMVTSAAGYLAPIKTDELKPVGVNYRVANNQKLLSFYEPKITLEEGIALAMASTPSPAE